jgi:ligand-binding sensor domain-containing protein
MRLYYLLPFLITLALSRTLHDWQVISYMNDITAVQSTDDRLWVGTTGGAYTFYITDSTCVRYTNADGLGSLNLTSLAIDTYDNIYFGGKEGILTVFRQTSNQWQIYAELQQHMITDLSVSDDTLWVATDKGVAVFLIHDQQSQFRDLYENFPVMPEQIRRISIYNDYIFLASARGLYYAPANFIKYNLKDANNWQIVTRQNGLPSDSIYDIAEMGGTLLVATAKGLCTIDPDLNIAISSAWTFGEITHLIPSTNKLFAASGNRLFAYEHNQWLQKQRYAKNISCGIIDRKGVLWLGFNDGGLQNEAWTQSFLMDGPPDNFIGRLTEDSNGHIWMMSGVLFGSAGKGFYQYNRDYWNAYFFSGPSRIDWKNYTSTVFEDHNGNLWIGCWGGGITLLKQDEIILYNAFNSNGDLYISNYFEQKRIALEEVPEERRYCFPTLDSETSPLSMNVSQFLEDDQGNLWCADYSASGRRCIVIVPKLSDGSYSEECNDWLYYGPHVNLSSAECEITCMEFDFLGRLWFGTRREGLLVLDYNRTLLDLTDDKLAKATVTSDNLLSNTVLSLKMDHDGIMWIGTGGGLNSYDGRQMYRHLGESGEFGPVDNRINEIFVDRYNNKWFATDGGISVLDASKSPWDAAAWYHYTPENSGLPSKYTKSIFVDNDQGEVFIGTDTGLAVFKGNFAQIREKYENISAGPNPFLLENNSEFIITNLMVKSTVKIFTINAKLIRTLSPNNGLVQGSRAVWDGRDAYNNLVPSGVYLFLAYAEDGTATQGKIAVIRP